MRSWLNFLPNAPLARMLWLLAFLTLTLFVLSATVILPWWSARSIAMPTRPVLTSYYTEFLATPEAHGLSLSHLTTPSGVPCLVATPTGNPSEKGQTLRNQLLLRQITLPPANAISGTIVLLHARNGRKENLLPIAERFCACGFRCILPDLPGHGDHPLPTTTYGPHEANLPATVLQEVSDSLHFSPQPAFLCGISMGASISIHSASETNSPWKAISAIACFDSLNLAIQRQGNAYFGSSLSPFWTARTSHFYSQLTGFHLNQCSPLQRASQIHVPTQLIQGEQDPIAPLSCAHSIIQNLPPSVDSQLVVVPNAKHDDVLVTDFPTYQHIIAWFIRHSS